MANLKSPNVFIEEVEPASAPRGITASQMGVVGFTLRGPVNEPTFVESLNEFTQIFGNDTDRSLVPLTTEQFFKNGGARMAVVRVVPDGSTKALVDIDAPVKWTFRAKWEGSWGNDVVIQIVGNGAFLDEAVPEWTKYDILVLEPDPFSGILIASEVFEAVQFTAADQPDYAPTVVNDSSSGSSLVVLEELSGGVPDAFVSNTITGESAGLGDGVKKRFQGTLDQAPLVIRSTVTFTDGVQTAVDDGVGNLTGDVDPSGNNRIDYETGEYDVTFLAASAASAPITVSYTGLVKSEDYAMSGGTDGTGVITRAEVSHPNLEGQLKGIFAFDKILDIFIVCLPDFTGDITVMRDLVDLADARRDRFALVQPPLGSTVAAAEIWIVNQLNRYSKRAACYFPGVKWKRTQTGVTEVVPNCGIVAGIYARTEANRNVSKAPAGKTDGKIEGAQGPEFVLSQADRDRLFERRINPIVSTTPTGFAVWGARTLFNVTTGLSANFRHVGPVRTFMFLEEDVFQGLHWAVFENNGPNLWQKIRNYLNGRFSSFFDAGLFAGKTKADAFTITVDATNNTEEDINAGIVNIDVAIAVNLPAEFIVVRFQQKTARRI